MSEPRPAGGYLDVVGAIGAAIVAGRPYEDLISTGPPDVYASPSDVAGRLYEAVPRAAGATLADWPGLWIRFEANLVAGVVAIAGWLGRLEAARPIERALERRIVESGVPAGTSIGSSVAVDVDVRDAMVDIPPVAAAEQLVVRVWRSESLVGSVVVPVIDGRATASDIAWVIRCDLAARLGRVVARHPLDVRHLAAPSALPHTARAAIQFVVDAPARRSGGGFALGRRAAGAFVRTSMLRNLSDGSPSATGVGTGQGVRYEPIDPADVAYWEDWFSVVDPWGYTSAYEQTKYEQTLELLGDDRYERVLEVACAEGHFTIQLAPLVGSLIATDISPTALARAAERCSAFDNISYQQLDLRNDELPDQLDLLVCSECLYFLDDPVELARVASRFAAALKPGGRFLHAHARQLVDEPDGVGFDWARSFGAKRMGEIFAADPNLSLVSEIVTDLYLVQMFERPQADLPGAVPVTERRAHGELHDEIRRLIVSGSFAQLRTATRETEVTNRLPMLMYHRISDDGPPALARYRVTPEAFEAQLDFLRSHGYYGITMPDWRYAMSTGKALPGRAVMVTFDDGYRDFLEQAWPLLSAYKFPANVYVVADLAGTESSWDAHHGPPAALMDWNEIRHLHRNGVHFGTHSATHRQLTTLSPQEVVDQERRARARFASELGVDAVDLAYPFGDYDALVRAAARRVGYRSAVTTDPGLATVWDDPLAIPRVEVTGDTDLDEFVNLLGTTDRRNLVGRAAKSVLRRLRQ
ncbi:MAG TPA: polysaccharide deacetylase family protein [Ilumatobacter sp.]|nr:polysaccharide deacetylase family protein [Ilumatobacter sp.]